jgi:osmotically-inducible protein OsmY
MAASERPHGAHQSSGRKPHIALAAEARLRGSPYLALRQISCGYRQGVLTLRGRLPTNSLKQLAQATVAEVEGVERIKNLIEVTAPPVAESAAGPPPAAAEPSGPASGPQVTARRVLIVR